MYNTHTHLHLHCFQDQKRLSLFYDLARLCQNIKYFARHWGLYTRRDVARLVLEIFSNRDLECWFPVLRDELLVTTGGKNIRANPTYLAKNVHLVTDSSHIVSKHRISNLGDQKYAILFHHMNGASIANFCEMQLLAARFVLVSRFFNTIKFGRKCIIVQARQFDCKSIRAMVQVHGFAMPRV